jgi:hypothetical protein
MEFSRQFTISRLYIVGGCGFIYSQYFIIVDEIHMYDIALDAKLRILVLV